jgi:hypothetical protein
MKSRRLISAGFFFIYILMDISFKCYSFKIPSQAEDDAGSFWHLNTYYVKNPAAVKLILQCNTFILGYCFLF